MADRRRVRRTAQQWSEIIEQFGSSGQSQEGFCAECGLALTTFQKYLRRAGHGDGKRAAGFVDVTPRGRAAPALAEAGVVVHAGGGISVQCPSMMGVAAVAVLVRALRDGR